MSMIGELAEYLFERKMIDAEERARAADSSCRNHDGVVSGAPWNVTLGTAGRLVAELGDALSLLLLGAPGIGKSEAVRAAAAQAGLPCRSIDASMLVPEDVLGLPRVHGERTHYCPPETLLPAAGGRYCLFIDELGAASPDVQKALYTLLLERRVGAHPLPPGSWVVAAGNGLADQAFARVLSSALLNRLLVLSVRADAGEWLAWAARARLRADIRAFVAFMPRALSRAPEADDDGCPRSFSSPRAWARLSLALDRTEALRARDPGLTAVIVAGMVSAEDAAVFTTSFDPHRHGPVERYLAVTERMPDDAGERWAVLRAVRGAVAAGHVRGGRALAVERFLAQLDADERMAAVVDLVAAWGALGADRILLHSFREVVSA